MIRLTRRTTLIGSATLLAAPAVLSGAPITADAFAQGTGAPAQVPGFYRFKVGDAVVTAIHDGFFARPIDGFVKNADLFTVQDHLKSLYLPTDKVVVSFTTLVVQAGGKTTLLDTGNGDSGAPTTGVWMSNFKAAGFDPAKVDNIVISHFHGDHMNGLRSKAGEANFPNATIHVPAPEYAFWMSDERMNAAPDAMKGAFAGVRRVFTPFGDKVVRFEQGKEVVPGIQSIAAPGHTPGHTIFALTSGNAKFLFVADLTNNPQLFARNPDWQVMFDMNGAQATETRKKVLDMAMTDRLQVSFYHAPFPATGFIGKNGNGYELIPATFTNAI